MISFSLIIIIFLNQRLYTKKLDFVFDKMSQAIFGEQFHMEV